MGGELFKAITYGHATCYENPLHNQRGFVMCGGDGVTRGKASSLGRSDLLPSFWKSGVSAQLLWVFSLHRSVALRVRVGMAVVGNPRCCGGFRDARPGLAARSPRESWEPCWVNSWAGNHSAERLVIPWLGHTLAWSSPVFTFGIW